MEKARSRTAIAPTEGGALPASPLDADWPFLLPPYVKTQMAYFGWSKVPVSYSLGSAQPPGDSRGLLSRAGG